MNTKESPWLVPREVGERLDPPITAPTVISYAEQGIIPSRFIIRNPGPRGRRKIHRDAIEYLQRIRRAA